MSNFITNLLLIKDQNITMEDKLDLINIDGQDTFVFHGTLSYEPKCCTNCGCKKEGNNIVKNGFGDSLKVALLKMSECPTYLRLKKQRFKCRECNSKFCAETPFVKKYCNISKNLILHIMKNLSKTLSFKDIAELSNISVSTVVRVMKSCREAVEVKTHTNLPEHLCFDEIKSTKDSKNGMSFVFLDAKTHDFIDIVDGRTQHILKQYFMRYPRKVRKKVKTICIDIYPPYMNMISEMFPNAEIIIDRFHMVQNINRELNKARVKLMNQYKNKKGSTYTILKNFWKVILEDRDKVNSTKTFYSRSFKRYVTRKEVLDYILAIDAEFTTSYERVHEIREAIKAKDSVELEKCIDIYPPYMNMIREMFPNTEIIIDRFHMVQNINRELNKARVKLMNQYKNKKGSTYTILKNFWKVILEDRDKVNSTKTFYSRSFKRYVTRKEVLDYILAIDAEFTASYERIHEIREAIKAKDSVELEKYIDMDTKGLSKGVSKAINTMKKHKEYMLNAVKYEYSNGPLEGFNNKIKLLKRVSYGYSSFSNFRLRILIMSRLFVSEYKNNIKLKENKKKSKQQNAA